MEDDMLTVLKYSSKKIQQRNIKKEDSNIINFGKHKGRTFKDIFDNELSYCKWIINNEDSNPDPYFITFQRYCRKNSKNFNINEDSNVITFGQYKNRKFSEVLKEDPKYCIWLIFTNEFHNKIAKGFKEYCKEKFNDPLFPKNYVEKTGTVTRIIKSWYIPGMIKEGVLPDLEISRFEIIHEKYGDNSIFGVFVDYLIRRILYEMKNVEQFNNSKNIINDKLVCEIGLSKYIHSEVFELTPSYSERIIEKINSGNVHHIEFQETIQKSFDDIIAKSNAHINYTIRPQSGRNQDKIFLYEKNREYNKYQDKIQNYKNLNLKWENIIEDIWDISHLDQLYREGKSHFFHKPFPEELKEINKGIYLYLLQLAGKFSKNTINFNASLKYNKVCGDIDLIVDETLIEFKTTKIPNIQRDTAQCYCYYLLCEKNGIKISKIELHYLLHERIIDLPINFDLEKLKRNYIDLSDENIVN